MTGLGEWDDATPVYDLGAAPVAESDEEPAEEATTGVAGHVSTALASLDVAALAGGLVAQTVAREIQRQVRQQAAPIVAKAVAAVLTPERLDALREATSAAAEAELNPPEPEPGPEPEASPEPSATEEEPAPPLYYGTVDEFVREFITPVFRRNVGEETRADYRWSARWWESAEAVTRLEAIWRAWEHLRLDPATGASVWLRDHADHHLGVLMSPTGPFCRSKDTAEPGEPLPYERPPEGLFIDVREAVSGSPDEHVAGCE